MQTIFTYPPMPQGIDEKVIQPSATFKKEVFKVLGTIIFFMLTYISLMFLALGFAAVCLILAYILVVIFTKSITIMLGLGLAGLGLMVVYFLIKFVFSRYKTDRSNLIEVTVKEQPVLFSFIRQVAHETQAPFPKRIYLSADVNACVFYNSGFWSMFFPVRKNLQIGLGLVNSVNISEFKAILAHEFGHFSQRSMKLGSYVYNVNRVLYNMLYDNQGYESALAKWGAADGFFAIFASLTAGVVWLIQWILKKVFLLINKSYSSLSRQMEFHADAVAAYVSGSRHLVSSLYRIEVADLCYRQLLSCYENWMGDNIKPDNLYPQHQEIIKHLGRQYNIPEEHHLLQVNAQTLALFNQSRLVVKDQWASHPSNEDREAYLNKLNIPSETIYQSAWVIFENAEKLQQQMTAKVFEGVEFGQAPKSLSLPAFLEKFKKEEEDYSFDSQYKGFYDDRNITFFDAAQQALEALTEVKNTRKLEDILTDKVCRLPIVVKSGKEDVKIIKEILKGKSGIKNIDFDGKKYSVKEAAIILAELTRDLEESEMQLAQLDKQLFRFFYRQALKQKKANELIGMYQHLFENVKETESDVHLYQTVRQSLYPIFTHNSTLEEAEVILNEVAHQEKNLKKRIFDMLHLDKTENYWPEKQKEQMLAYSQSKDQPYLLGESLNQDAFFRLTEMLEMFFNYISAKAFKVKKDLLQTQIALSNTPELRPEYS